MTRAIEPQFLKPLVRAGLETGNTSRCDSCEVLKGRSGDCGTMMRVTVADGASVIAKASKARNLAERVRSLLGLSMARREWRAHRHLERSGLAVPQLLQFFKLRCRDGRRFEVIVMEDLGPTRNGLVYLKDLLAAGDEAGVRRFEERVMALTSHLLDAGIVDEDHQLLNIVINGTDRPIRIDFECARRFASDVPPVMDYGRMIGRLVVTHAYACQPELTRTECFARRLAEHLDPPRAVLDRAEAQIAHELARQRKNKGIDSRLKLDW